MADAHCISHFCLGSSFQPSLKWPMEILQFPILKFVFKMQNCSSHELWNISKLQNFGKFLNFRNFLNFGKKNFKDFFDKNVFPDKLSEKIWNGQKWQLQIFSKKTGKNSEWPKLAIPNFF